MECSECPLAIQGCDVGSRLDKFMSNDFFHLAKKVAFMDGKLWAIGIVVAAILTIVLVK